MLEKTINQSVIVQKRLKKISKINKGVNDKVTKEGNMGDRGCDHTSDGGNDIINISGDELRSRCIIGMVNLLLYSGHMYKQRSVLDSQQPHQAARRDRREISG